MKLLLGDIVLPCMRKARSILASLVTSVVVGYALVIGVVVCMSLWGRFVRPFRTDEESIVFLVSYLAMGAGIAGAISAFILAFRKTWPQDPS